MSVLYVPYVSIYLSTSMYKSPAYAFLARNTIYLGIYLPILQTSHYTIPWRLGSKHLARSDSAD